MSKLSQAIKHYEDNHKPEKWAIFKVLWELLKPKGRYTKYKNYINKFKR